MQMSLHYNMLAYHCIKTNSVVAHTLYLSQLKGNGRTRVERKSGEKSPEPNDTDVEIVPALDSQEILLTASAITAQDKKLKILNAARNHELLGNYEYDDLINLESKTSTQNEITLKDILKRHWPDSNCMKLVNKLVFDAEFFP